MMVSATRRSDDILPFLGSLQLADSLFPSGLYTLSHGLEAFAQNGYLSADTLEPLLADYLRHGTGPTDGVATACAHRGAELGDLDLAERADLRLTAVKLAREGREASVRTGRQLLTLAGRLFGDDVLGSYAARVRRGAAPGNHAIALGLTMSALAIPRDRAVAGELYAFAASCAGAAIRLAAIDHRVAQLVLHRLKPVIAEVAHAASDQTVEDIAGCVPLVDIMAMRHERAEVRLFMT